MMGSAQPTRFALEGAITIDTAGRVNRSGAFCDLYTGTHPIAGKLALKMPRDSSYNDTMKLIESEAGVWIKLNHPRILKFLGLYTVNEVIYLVSPFAEFGSLPSYLQSFPDADRGRFIIEIAEGLVYLHQLEPAIVHGDVKGNNVLVASDHHARLCDFGLARHVDARTATGLKGAGSIRWQSPEILRGQIKSLQSDVYAFGITIYEVLSGKVPYFDHHIDSSVMTGVLLFGLRPPLEPSSAPDGTSYLRFWGEAKKCWSDSPAERPSMADILRRLSDQGPGIAEDDPNNWALPLSQGGVGIGDSDFDNLLSPWMSPSTQNRPTHLSTFTTSPTLYSGPFSDHLRSNSTGRSLDNAFASPVQTTFNLFDDLDSAATSQALFELMVHATAAQQLAASDRAPETPSNPNGSKPTDLGLQLGRASAGMSTLL